MMIVVEWFSIGDLLQQHRLYFFAFLQHVINGKALQLLPIFKSTFMTGTTKVSN